MTIDPKAVPLVAVVMEEAEAVATYSVLDYRPGKIDPLELSANSYVHGFDDGLRLGLDEPALGRRVLAQWVADLERLIARAAPELAESTSELIGRLKEAEAGE